MADDLLGDFHRRRSWFEAHADEGAAADASGTGVVPCPCCGYPTLSERDGFETCRVCWWEDDGQDDDSTDEIRGGPNRDYSLTAARRNFASGGSVFSASDEPPGGAVRGARARKLAEAFDAVVAATNAAERRALWQDAWTLMARSV